MSKRFLAVLLALVMTLGLLPCSGAEPAEIILTTQDGTRFEGTVDTRVTIRVKMWSADAEQYVDYDVDSPLFFWSAYRHYEFGYLSVHLSDDQADWGESQEGPATVEVDGQVFSGTVNCWFPNSWVLSFHPDDGDDSPAGQAIHKALYSPKEDQVYALSPDTGFSDVAAEDWFAPYVDVCVEAGLMEGVGGGRFDPERSLTNRECAILALRLHQMGRGGDGTFDPAPADWDYFVLTLADGTVLSQGYLGGYAGGRDLQWASPRKGGGQELGFYLGWEDNEDKAWGLALADQAATLNVNGVSYFGALTLNATQDYIFFLPYPYQLDAYQTVHDGYVYEAGTGWWRDGWYYARQNGLGELLGGDDEAPRWSFAYKIAKVTDLSAINDIADNAVPDLDPRSVIDQSALHLYRAGILNGVDSQGTFSGNKTLTRAEAAAMLARVLDPDLRLRFTLQSPFTRTDLTGLTDLGEAPRGAVWRTGQGFAAYSTDDGQRPVWTLMTVDGRRLTLDGEPHWWDGGLLVLCQTEPFPWRFGVLDLKTLDMVLPYGPYAYCTIEEDGLRQDGFHIITNDPAKDYPTYLVWDDPDHPAELESNADEWRRTFACGLRRTWSFEDSLYGYVDKNAQFVIPPQWADAQGFRDGYAAVAVANGDRLLWGVIDTQGNTVVPPRYGHMENCGQGVFYGSSEKAQSLVFAGSAEPLERPLEEYTVLSFQNGYAVYELENGKGAYYMDLNGTQASPLFDWACPVSADGTALVGLNGHVYRWAFAS